MDPVVKYHAFDDWLAFNQTVPTIAIISHDSEPRSLLSSKDNNRLKETTQVPDSALSSVGHSE